MTGGMAFVYDPEGAAPACVNPDTVVLVRIASAHWEGVLKDLIEEHVRRTGSARGEAILAGWTQARSAFWQVVPKEMLSRLAHPLDDSAATIAAE